MINKDLIDNLTKGLFLETSKILLPWNTSFEILSETGKPDLKEISKQRSDLMWKDETILNGLSVDLTIMRHTGFLGVNKKFSCAFGFIAKMDFEKTKERLNLDSGQEGKYIKINDSEDKFVWKIGKTTITLSHHDKYGEYYQVEIQHNNGLFGIF